jgi:hypothetical protein
LRGETLSIIKHTKTGIRNEGEEDLRGYISGLVKVNKEANAKGYVKPFNLKVRAYSG